MADALPRRYLTRARAQGGDSSNLPTRLTTAITTTPVPTSATTSSLPQRTTRSTISGGKRKALADATLENSRDNEPAASRAAKSARKPAPKSKATTEISNISIAASGLSAAPRRSGRTRSATLPVKRLNATTICPKTPAHTKKAVAFASPAASEDKENALPFRPTVATPEKAARRTDDLEETDVLMSTSMGALSVKPRRPTVFPKTKIQQPSTGTFAESIPALSPQKVRRPKRLFDIEDPELEDELLCPTSPRLQEKPKRPLAPLGKKNIIDGAGLLIPVPKTSTLFGSPARRFSPTKPKDSTTQMGAQTSPSKNSALSSPARRPGMGSRLGMPISKSTTKGTSLKFSITNTMDASADPFSDLAGEGIDDDIFQSKSVVERKLFVEEVAKTPKIEDNRDFKELVVSIKNKSISDADSKSSVPVPVSSATSSPEDSPVGTGADEEDGDIIMSDIPKTLQTQEAKAALIKKHKSPSQGGSSFGLFDSDDDEDDGDCDSENIPPQVEASRSENQAGEREFGKVNIEDTKTHISWGDIPVDPMLLSEDISNVVTGYSEGPARKTTVPVKFHSEDDDVFVDDNQENQYTPSADVFDGLDSRRRRNSSTERSGGVLAGAVVYVDVYTNDGADCGEGFEKMLKNMGAKVLKQWSWNPNSPSPGKVGITHVVFKDGSPRTLQKVKATHGLVSCVALKWIIECAQLDEWLDESLFSIDLDDVPRGGYKV